MIRGAFCEAQQAFVARTFLSKGASLGSSRDKIRVGGVVKWDKPISEMGGHVGALAARWNGVGPGRLIARDSLLGVLPRGVMHKLVRGGGGRRAVQRRKQPVGRPEHLQIVCTVCEVEGTNGQDCAVQNREATERVFEQELTPVVKQAGGGLPI